MATPFGARDSAVHGLRSSAGLLLILLILAAPLAAQVVHHGFNPAFMDTATRPGDDFYQYAVGRWLATAVVPPEYSRFGVDDEVELRTCAVVRAILESAAGDASAPEGGGRRKVGDFYAAGMDLAAIEGAGLGPLAAEFAGIRRLRDRSGLARELAVLHRRGIGPGFGFYVDQDDQDSSRPIANLVQGGLGLPERDYYLRKDRPSRELRGQYATHVARMFGLLGESPALARRHATTVLVLETRLAGASMDRVARRDPRASYHRMTQRELAASAPGLDWAGYFRSLGLGPGEAVLVRQPGFMKELGRMAAALPLDAWRTYLRWWLIRDTAADLSSSFDQASFDFYGRILQGAQAPLPRWRRMLLATDEAMPELLGQLYVERAFPPEAKARVLAMVDNLRAALARRIRQLPWMSGPTRERALAKLDALAVKIGYPDRPQDYATLPVDRRCHLANVLAARAWDFDRNLAKLGRPVDRGEWEMSAITNNAYYNPSLNEIVFPAGILQPPFFDPEADDAVNYGNIGATIGHEMTHAFDDEGRQYDGQGNLVDWWTAGDATAFTTRAELMVKQFDRFEPLPSLHVHGRATLGENIADLGGLKIAYDAFQKVRAAGHATDIDGFTPEQRFFLGYAETWRQKIREQALREALLTDAHAPAKYRVNGPLANLPEFHEAFGIKDGEPMKQPEAERPVIW